jgi:membrane-bound lytic murein transglycosylase B
MRGRIAVTLAFLLLTNLPVRTQNPVDSPPDARLSFRDWLADVRTEALARGVRPEILDVALTNVTEPLPVVIERDRAQTEAVLPLETYISRQLSAARIRTGRQMYAKHRSLVDRVAAHYQIPPHTIVSIWGAESNFGRFTGVRPTVEALATLAWDPRRSTLFRGELFHALDILNRGDIGIADMRGSWAGAMGQPQFMPSSYLKYAEDFDGDGRRDIWGSQGDIFASIANYLKGYGWTPGQLWGREVTVPKETGDRIAADVAKSPGSGRCQASRDMTVRLPLAEWEALGVRAANGRPLPTSEQTAALVSGKTRHFLVYSNYDVLLAYNCAHAYALSVALFSDQLR